MVRTGLHIYLRNLNLAMTDKQQTKPNQHLNEALRGVMYGHRLYRNRKHLLLFRYVTLLAAFWNGHVHQLVDGLQQSCYYYHNPPVPVPRPSSSLNEEINTPMGACKRDYRDFTVSSLFGPVGWTTTTTQKTTESFAIGISLVVKIITTGSLRSTRVGCIDDWISVSI